MQPIVIPSELLFFVSMLVSIVSHKLRSADNRLSAGVNSLIAFAAILLILLVTGLLILTTPLSAQQTVLFFCSVLVSLAPSLKELFDIAGYQLNASTPLAQTPEPFPPVRRQSRITNAVRGAYIPEQDEE